MWPFTNSNQFLTLTVPRQEGAIILAVLSTVPLLLAYQTIAISKARAAAKLKYPQFYATPDQVAADPKMMRLNCCLRANANTLEFLPMFVISLLITSVRFPQLAAGLGVVFQLTSFTYTLGYTTGKDPKARYSYKISHLRIPSVFVLMLTSAYSAFELLWTATSK